MPLRYFGNTASQGESLRLKSQIYAARKYGLPNLHFDCSLRRRHLFINKTLVLLNAIQNTLQLHPVPSCLGFCLTLPMQDWDGMRYLFSPSRDERCRISTHRFGGGTSLLRQQIIGAGGESQIEGPRRRSQWTFIARLVAASASPGDQIQQPVQQGCLQFNNDS